MPKKPNVPPESDKDEPIISLRELSKKFNGVKAVNNLSMSIPRGSIFGFIGPSGCGKTTTIRLILGLYEPDSGQVEVLGTAPDKFGKREREAIGYMPQHATLYPELTVSENLNFAASLYGVPLRRRKRLEELLQLVELADETSKKVGDLSGGMQRRLSLAAAIVHRPQLIMLDEPTAGIDPILRNKFWDYFRTLKGAGETLFVATQYVNEAANCDFVGVMVDGRLLMVETPTELRRRATGGDIIHLETEDYLRHDKLDVLRNQEFVVGRNVKRQRGRQLAILVEDASSALPLVLDWCRRSQIAVESANQYLPSFDEVFVSLIDRDRDTDTNDSD
ncbi:MAG: ABC transporter ATP-binding protein [Candidatus Promineifilaceae bacterium]|nr:ABC transporter ATP-binding protein [Candidatus Promineifilaceae bacterium]